MEGVDHVHVVQIGGGGFVGQAHRMLERQVPDREGFKLGIARVDAPGVLLVELAQAGGHFAAAGAGGRHQHQRAAGFDIFVAAKAVLAHDQLHVIGVALDGIMAVDPNA